MGDDRQRPTWDVDEADQDGTGDGRERRAGDAEQPDIAGEKWHSVWSTLDDVALGVATRHDAARLTRTVAPSVMRPVEYRGSVPGCEMRI